MSELHVCKICGSTIDSDSYDVGPQMEERQLCFTCNFWQNQLDYDQKERKEHEWAVINGVHYVIGDENNNSPFRGFGGEKFIINFNDGTIVRTTNLWCQGVIPSKWRDKFPDNAILLQL